MMTNDPHKPLVLIVDDTPTNIQVLAEALAADYRIKVATGGRAAFEVIEKHGLPDVILLDIMMPDIDGYEVCRQLKQNADTSNIPIIFVTARNDVHDEEYGLRLGAVDYITKPFHISIVKARLGNHLRISQLTKLLENMAWMDGLTCIPNRRRFDDALNIEWLRAQRALTPLSIIMLDIDYFKQYNDNYGHGAGDECLKKVANVLAATGNRAADLVARYGGEEFVLLVPETSAQGVLQLAEQLRQNVESLHIPHEYSQSSHWVSISLGCATAVPSVDKNAAMLLEQADAMLYQAKKQGRNCVCGE